MFLLLKHLPSLPSLLPPLPPSNNPATRGQFASLLYPPPPSPRTTLSLPPSLHTHCIWGGGLSPPRAPTLLHKTKRRFCDVFFLLSQVRAEAKKKQAKKHTHTRGETLFARLSSLSLSSSCLPSLTRSQCWGGGTFFSHNNVSACLRVSRDEGRGGVGVRRNVGARRLFYKETDPLTPWTEMPLSFHNISLLVLASHLPRHSHARTHKHPFESRGLLPL